MPKLRNINTLPLDGGVLCFHFINTVYAWRGENLHEYLDRYDDVINWCAKVDILNAQKRKKLLQFAKQNPAEEKKALKEIKKTRALLYNFFSVVAASGDQQMPKDVLTRFNAALSDGFSHLHFEIKQKQVTLDWTNADINLLEPVWIVMKSAYDVLTMDDRSRLKECQKCGWLFMDKTKNNKRRWCNPATCGSTEKSKKYYQKIKRNN